MKNFEKYAEEGQKKINKNSRFDMQVSDMDELLKLARVDMCEALRKAFNAGVEAGSRIEKKTAADQKGKQSMWQATRGKETTNE